MGNVERLKGGYEAFGRGDVPSVLALFDPNIEWREAESNPYKPDGKAWIGGDAIVANLFMRLGSEWDGFTVTPNEFHDAGDTVAVARSSVRHKKNSHSARRDRGVRHPARRDLPRSPRPANSSSRGTRARASRAGISK